MARHYIDTLVLRRILREESRPRWVDELNEDQLFSSVRDVYTAIGEYLGTIRTSASHNPVVVLPHLVSFVGRRHNAGYRALAQRGDPTLDRFFDIVGDGFRKESPTINPCELAFEGTIASVRQFMDGRYSTVTSVDLATVVYKAFAGAAGSVIGDCCFWRGITMGKPTGNLATLDSRLRNGMQSA